jgi:hypothetical protein
VIKLIKLWEAGKIVKPVAPILPDLTLRGLRTNDETTSHVCGVSEHHLIKRTHACLASNVLPCKLDSEHLMLNIISGQ